MKKSEKERGQSIHSVSLEKCLPSVKPSLSFCRINRPLGITEDSFSLEANFSVLSNSVTEDGRNLAPAWRRERTDMKLAFAEALFTLNLWGKRKEKEHNSK